MSALTAASGEPQSIGDPGQVPPTEFLELIGETVDNVRSLALYELLRARLCRVVPIASPAVGTNWAVTVPLGAVWQVQSITATLTTSAVAGNRLPSLNLTAGGVIYARVPGVTVVAASSSAIYGWNVTYGSTNSPDRTLGFIAPFPDLPMQAGDTITVNTLSLDAGDQWSAVALYVREWSVGQVYWAADLIGRELGFEHLTDLPASTPLPEGTGQAIPVSPLAR